MDEFKKRKADEMMALKKIYTASMAQDVVEKVCLREDLKDIEKELEKCFFGKKDTDISNSLASKRRNYINNFLSEIVILREKLEKNAQKTVQKQPQSKNNNKAKDKDFKWNKKLVIDNENFPKLESYNLVKNKKNFVVLDRHYENKLQEGVLDCYCMSSRHPLVVNCLSCGRVHCLQEGDKVCINCGKKLVLKDEYLKSIVKDYDAKNAYNHKEKLLKFQANFYSKLKIIDDFNDWYEISNNTWLSEENRKEARKKDEEGASMKECLE